MDSLTQYPQDIQGLVSSLRKVRRAAGGGFIACCPAHDDKTPSLSIDVGHTGKIIYKCFSGCSQETVGKALGIAGDFDPREIRFTPKLEVAVDDLRKEAIEKVWKQRKSIGGTPVDSYLNYRCINRWDWQDLHFIDNLRYYHDGEFVDRFPSMVAAVRNIEGEIVTLHRTYLTLGGRKISSLNKEWCARKWMRAIYPGATRGAAIRLMEPTDELLIAEGIESAMAASILSGDTPVWAALSAGGLAAVEIPESVRTVTICADNDRSGVGLNAAKALEYRMLEQGKTVYIATPPEVGSDWADMLLLEESA